MPKLTRIYDATSLRPADHIAIWDRSRWPITYTHHGIVFQSGTDMDSILVVHVWSPLTDVASAQSDSHWRVSSLNDFIYGRGLENLRLIHYNTSGLMEITSRWGEVHLERSDIPEVVLARCRFLMGLGKGNFNIMTQNCEHAAYWCKTGKQWSKQSLIRRSSKVPFNREWDMDRLDALKREIEDIRRMAREEGRKVSQLNGSYAVIRVNSDFVLCEENGKFYARTIAQTPRNMAAKLRLKCYQDGYNYTVVEFQHDEHLTYIYCKPFTQYPRTIGLQKRGCFRSPTGFKFELTPFGDLVALRQHRRFLSLNDDGLLVDLPNRDSAARFELIEWNVWMSEMPLPQSPFSTPVVQTPTSTGLIQNLGRAITGFSRFYIGLPRLPFIVNAPKPPVEADSSRTSTAGSINSANSHDIKHRAFFPDDELIVSDSGAAVVQSPGASPTEGGFRAMENKESTLASTAIRPPVATESGAA